MNKETTKGKIVKCYGKTYKSMKELARDFGIKDSDTTTYIKLTQLIKKGISPEDAIEKILNSITTSKNTNLEDTTNNVSNKIIAKDDEKEYIKNNNPIYFNINNHLQLIEELKKMNNVHNINIIDFENMRDDLDILKKYIDNEDTINIFFYNACIYSNKFFKIIKYTNNINLQVLTYEVENQLVDHLLVFYLGALMGAFPDKHFTVISKDFGFYPFVNSISRGNIDIVPGTYINDKEERYKYSLCNYIVNNNYLKIRDCVIREEFKCIFDKWYDDRPITSNMIDDIINKLIQYQLLFEVIQYDKVMYKFDINAAERIVHRFLE